jgi:tetratricopeptide (TPR) repeat protein
MKNKGFLRNKLDYTAFGGYIYFMDKYFKKSILFSAAALLTFAAGCGDPDPAELIAEAGEAVSAGNWQKVMEAAEELQEIAPADPNAWLFAALACEHSGDIPGALEASARGAELCPESFYCQYNRGRLLFMSGKEDQAAFQFLARAYKISPDNTDCLLLLVQCAAKLNIDPSSFYNKLNSVAREMAGKTEIQTTMGVYLVSANPVGSPKWSTGMAFLQNAYNKAPDNPMAALNFARALDQSPQYQQAALPIYEKYLLLVKNNPEAAGGSAEAEARIKAIQRSSR